MHPIFFGSLVCAALVAGGGARAGEAPATGFDGAASVHDNRPVAKPKKGHAAAAPLSAAAAYKATQADLPAAPLHARTPPAAAEKPWTGVYVGVNAGAAK